MLLSDEDRVNSMNYENVLNNSVMWRIVEVVMAAEEPIHVEALDYLIQCKANERKVAVLGSDGTNDVQPSGIPEEGSPVHKLTLVAMGMPLLDNLNLEKLSKMAQKQKRWEFMISILPLRFKGGTGSPVNAIALF